MKALFATLTLALSLFSFRGQAQAELDSEGFPTFTYTEGDTSYTMRQYVFVLLKTGPNRNQSEAEVTEIQRGHLAHLAKMEELGYLVVAGPMGDDTELRGICVYNVNDVEKVKELVNEDPAIKAGRLIAEIHPWWAARGTKLP